jgi:hypothetical protein
MTPNSDVHLVPRGHTSCAAGFMTTKGELVRAILFPPPHDFKFFSDFLKSVYVFLVLGLIGMAYSLTMWIRNGVSKQIQDWGWWRGGD